MSEETIENTDNLIPKKVKYKSKYSRRINSGPKLKSKVCQKSYQPFGKSVKTIKRYYSY